MGLHDRAFIGIQPAGLEQDPVGDADLADVMQRGEHADMLDEFIG